MFRRLIFESSAAWFTIAAFVIAFSIYVLFAWRALRMKRTQVRYFEYLPFEIETPEAQELAGRAPATVSKPVQGNTPRLVGTPLERGFQTSKDVVPPNGQA
jgi:hypothetical protein